MFLSRPLEFSVPPGLIRAVAPSGEFLSSGGMKMLQAASGELQSLAGRLWSMEPTVQVLELHPFKTQAPSGEWLAA